MKQRRRPAGPASCTVDLAGLTRIELGFAVLPAVASGGIVLALGLAERCRIPRSPHGPGVWDKHWFAPTRTLDVTPASLRGGVRQPRA
ncbi:hypothetical protein [Streptomyces niveus]|uniref:hypothetical protein n=1 Tax=Streptomyces niveus TaxID=193462 RepID=UPI003415CD3F